MIGNTGGDEGESGFHLPNIMSPRQQEKPDELLDSI